jgi:mRNA-degrading endonuclease RelE of RelBE toxin-antitoxin system
VKWRVFFDPAAEKQFSKLGKSAQRDIEKSSPSTWNPLKTRAASASPIFQSREPGDIASVTTGWYA